MTSFGDRLRLEREKGNLSVEEIAARTEIDPRFLRALEQEEFDALPGKAIGKFYIRAYAEILGFDPRTLISAYDAEQRRQRPAGARASRERPRRRVEAALDRWRAARAAQAARAPEGPPAVAPEGATVAGPGAPQEAAAARGDEAGSARVEPGPGTDTAPEAASVDPRRLPEPDAGVTPTSVPAEAVHSEPPPSVPATRTASEGSAASCAREPSVDPAPQRVPGMATASPSAHEASSVIARGLAETEIAAPSVPVVPAGDPEARDDAEQRAASSEEVVPAGPAAPDPVELPGTSTEHSTDRARTGIEAARPSSQGPTAHDEAAALATILGSGAATAHRHGRRPVAKRPVALAALAFALIATSAILLLLLRGGPATEVGPLDVDPRAAGAAAVPLDAAASTGAGTPSAPPIGTPPPRSDGASQPIVARPETPRPDPGSRAATAQHLSVTELGVGSRIANHRLEGRADRFAQGSVVVFWTRVEGGSRGETIRHVWSYRGRVVQSVSLEIGGPHWRTYSRKTLREPGEWVVEARDAAGDVLGSVRFACVPAPR